VVGQIWAYSGGVPLAPGVRAGLVAPEHQLNLGRPVSRAGSGWCSCWMALKLMRTLGAWMYLECI